MYYITNWNIVCIKKKPGNNEEIVKEEKLKWKLSKRILKLNQFELLYKL